MKSPVRHGMRPFNESELAELVRHHFIGQDDAKGVYAKEIHIPAGFSMVSHRHAYDHLSILAIGKVSLKCGDKPPELLAGPTAITIRKGEEHSLYALTDAVWFCVHPTEETDAARVDAAILEQGVA